MDVKPARVIHPELQALTAFTLSPDGRRFGLSGNGGKKSEENDQGYEDSFFDVATGKPIGPPMVLKGLGQFTHDGSTVVYRDRLVEANTDIHGPNANWGIFLRDVASGKDTTVTRVPGPLVDAATAPDGKTVVVARKNEVWFLRLPDGKPAFPPAAAESPILGLSNVFLNGTRVATVHEGGKLILWDLTAGKAAGDMPVGRIAENFPRVRVADDGRTAVIDNRTIWDLAAKAKPKWEKVKDLAFFEPMSGGRVIYGDSTFETRIEQRPGGPNVTVLPTYFVAVADASTGRVTHRLLFDGQKEYEPWRTIVASADGQRVAALTPGPRVIHVWDLPSPPEASGK